MRHTEPPSDLRGGSARGVRPGTPAGYGDAFADVYDTWYPTIGDDTACVEALIRLAGSTKVLELGVGTGRLAIPLAERGLDVTGVDASRAMLDRLRAKQSDVHVRLVEADMASPGLRGEFGLIVIAYNTLFNLADRASQLRCLRSTAELLSPAGRLVIEAFVPPDPIGTAGPAFELRSSEPDTVVIIVSWHDPETTTITGYHIEVTHSGTRTRPWLVNYITPGELDAMAHQAGLVLDARHSDWSENPFDDASANHVSLYSRSDHQPEPPGSTSAD